MASIKTTEKLDERSVLSTTITKWVFDEFKAACKRSGVQMNTILEAFMRQYIEGGFYLKLAKSEPKTKTVTTKINAEKHADDINLEVVEDNVAIELGDLKDNFGEVLV